MAANSPTDQNLESSGTASADAEEPSTDPGPEPQVRVAGYSHYADAQAVVDAMSDAGMDITGTTITWSGLRQIEYVTGRRTTVTAARDGLLSGAWLGLLLSLLLLLFVEVDADTSELGLIVTWTLVFAAVGAGWSAIMHSSQRGTRDFATMPRLEAERYDVWVGAHQAAQVKRIIGTTSTGRSV